MFGKKEKGEKVKKSFKERMAEAMEQAERSGNIGTPAQVHVNGDLFIDGRKYHVAGAIASVESGANVGGRITATRVVTGAVVLGPLGAIIGGMAKKDRNKVYLIIELPDGTVLSKDYPAKEEVKVREFVGKVNKAGQYWAVQVDA